VDDDGDDLLYCPSCGKQVYEFTQKCPHCGDWITPAYRSPSRTRWWRILVYAVIAVFLLALLRFCV
jgi:predicted amidophosphoribosyltransferase